MPGPLFVIILLFVAVMSFAIGILVERKRWSDLIHQGRMPRPDQKWYADDN